jgi:hypothetical protein
MRIKDHIHLNCFLTILKNDLYCLNYTNNINNRYIICYIMSRFIQLTNILINSSKIIFIQNTGNTYYVKTCGSGLTSGISIFGFGFIDTSTSYNIEICKNKHPTDYEIMEKWVRNLK